VVGVDGGNQTAAAEVGQTTVLALIRQLKTPNPHQTIGWVNSVVGRRRRSL